MNEAKPERTLGIYLTVLFQTIGFFFVVTLSVFIRQDFLHPYNIVVHVLLILSIVGLWLMEKWGAALTIVMASLGVFTSLHELQVAYLNPSWIRLASSFRFIVAASGLYLIIGSIIVWYMFKGVFEQKFD